MTKLKRFLKDNFSVFILAGGIVVIAATNYHPGTWLSGWDNLHPEFNFAVNIKRSVFAVWQEYQGLGLLGGMGHAADLPRQIFLWIALFVLPDSFIRYFFHFLMLLIGPLGVYYLLKNIVLEHWDSNNRIIGGLFGSFFYLFNLATLQMFYLPFEPYSMHYGLLPWLFWGYLNFLKAGNRKNLFLLLVVNLLAVAQGYVITFFFVYMISLSLLSLYFLFKKQMWRKIIVSYILIFLINSFWLLPNLYFVSKKVDVNVSAKINQMSTEDNLLRNKKFGNLANTAILKGFLFDNVEVDKEGVMRYQMEDWKKHLDNPVIPAIGYILFALVVIGIFYSIKNRKKEVLIFLPILFFSFTILSSDAPFFSFITSLFYKIPLFSQIFRFPFTKFSILTAFSFSVFFSYESLALINSEKNHYLRRIIFTILISLPLIFLAPVFAGKFFYQKERAEIPQEYFQVFDFFQKQDKGRIANFPQYTFWGWSLYRWNFSGSGFLWYGIEQPILDRAFDVWSKEDENYYHEISYALYSRNQKLFEDILEKYQIRWLLVDGNIISFASGKTLYLDHLEQFIASSDKFFLAGQFGKIKIYKVNLETSPKDFVFLASDLTEVGPKYDWNNFDKAYEEYGNYISENQELRTKNYNLLSGRAGLTVESNPKEKENNHHQGKSDSSISINSPKVRITHDSSSNSSNLTVDNKQNIPSSKSTVNIERLDNELSEPKFGTISIAANQPADRLINSPEKALSQGLEKSSSTQLSYQDKIRLVNFAYAADGLDLSTPGESSSATPGVSFGFDIYYPFRSLFTGRKQEELGFGVEDRGDYFSFRAKIPRELVGANLVIPKVGDEEISEVDENDLSKSTKKYQQIFLDGELISIHPRGVMASPPEADQPATPGVENTPEVSIPLSYIKEGMLEVRVPKINGYYSYNQSFDSAQDRQPKNCDQFNQGILKHELVNENGKQRLRLTSIGSSNCLDFDLSHLTQRLGYLVTVENRNIEGKSLLFSIINKNSQRADIETYLPKLNSYPSTVGGAPSGHPRGVLTAYFVLPPMEPFGLGYALHLDNISIGRVKTVNDLGRITVNPIPYRFLSGLKIVKGLTDSSTIGGVTASQAQPATPEVSYRVDHPNPSLYQVSINNETIKQLNNLTMVLSQSSDSGWHAYQSNNSLFPFLFGKELKNHVLVNNWANGWNLNNLTMKQSNNETITIVYLPQYLEYIGFGLLLFVPLLLVKTPRNILE